MPYRRMFMLLGCGDCVSRQTLREEGGRAVDIRPREVAGHVGAQQVAVLINDCHHLGRVGPLDGGQHGGGGAVEAVDRVVQLLDHGGHDLVAGLAGLVHGDGDEAHGVDVLQWVSARARV